MRSPGRCHLLMSPLMTAEEMAGWVTAAELQATEAFGSERRRLEYLSWRALVRQHYGVALQFAYNTLGAPYLVNHPEYHLSVSHTDDAVVVLVSEHRCGVDMERLDRRFRHIQTKYLTAEEESLSDHPHFLAIAWCAKEALYKYAGERALDFRRDLRLLALDPEKEEGQLLAQIKDGEPLRLTVHLTDEQVLVYLIEA